MGTKIVYTCDHPYCDQFFDTEEECAEHMSECRLRNTIKITKCTFYYSTYTGVIDMCTEVCHGYVWGSSYFTTDGDAYICGMDQIDKWIDDDNSLVRGMCTELTYCAVKTPIAEVKAEVCRRIKAQLNRALEYISSRVSEEIRINEN